MADLSITAASVAQSSAATTVTAYLAGATITAGQVVYLSTANAWLLADCDAAATGNGVANVRGIALNGAASGQPLHVCTRDTAFTPGATLTAGEVYVLSGTAGGIAPVGDLTTGDYTVVLGVAVSTSVLNLNPTAAGVTHA